MSHRDRIRLSDLYSGDRRTTDERVRGLADRKTIPHPLQGVHYADGTMPGSHARRYEPRAPLRTTERLGR